MRRGHLLLLTLMLLPAPARAQDEPSPAVQRLCELAGDAHALKI